MCVALDKGIVVAGYVKKYSNRSFSPEDIIQYTRSLWNAGCGPVILNFTKQDLDSFLSSLDPIIQRRGDKYQANIEKIDVEEDLLRYFKNHENARYFKLFCILNARFNTPKPIINAMGYDFLYIRRK